MGAVHAALSGRSAGPVFLPWVWELAAERAGIDVTAMAASPTELVSALSLTAELVESDAVVVLVDDLDAPALEALRRLAAAAGRRDRVAVVPGPCLLAERRGLGDADDRDEAAEDLARAALETRVDVLALDEPRPDPSSAGCFRTLARMAAFHGARTLVIGPAAASFALDAGVDAVDCGPAGPLGAGVAVAAPLGVPSGLAVVTTPWSPRSTDAEALRARAREVHGQRRDAVA
ncbi:MAG TPA: hypothetical protein VK611_03030 [Acidimicrobiales bacterium]|nr:hypothetical protein [Acidimicrobiales bacterium]